MNCGGDATAHFNAGGGLAVDGLPTGRPKPKWSAQCWMEMQGRQVRGAIVKQLLFGYIHMTDAEARAAAAAAAAAAATAAAAAARVWLGT